MNKKQKRDPDAGATPKTALIAAAFTVGLQWI
jgi:hypothetical protein